MSQPSKKEIRFLSYNLNLLPMGTMSLTAGYKVERMELFQENHMTKYDVVALQEVFATPILPTVVATQVCRQHRFITRAKEIGFHFCVTAPAPSYTEMLRRWKWTDSGLVILSRYRICAQGFQTFKNQGSHIDRGATKGCLWARVRLPEATDKFLLVFNCHLQATHTTKDTAHYHRIRDDQLREMKVFMEGVLFQYCSDPYVIVGDFNIDSMTVPDASEQYGYAVSNPLLAGPSRSYLHMMTILDPYHTLRDLLLHANNGAGHASTRPPRLAFPRNMEAISQHRYPMCTDYILASSTLLVSPGSAKVVRFHAPVNHPFEYLSDHFGLEALFEHEVGPGEEGIWELQDPDVQRSAFPWHVGAVLFALSPYLFLSSTFLLALWMVFVAVIVAKQDALKVWLVQDLPREPILTSVIDVGGGERTTEIISTPHVSIVEIQTARDNWLRAVQLYGWLPSLGSRPIVADGTRGPYVWASYKDIHIRALNFARGLQHLVGLGERPKVIIMSENRRNWLIADMASCLGGFVMIPVALGAEPEFLRDVMRESQANVIVCIRQLTSVVIHNALPSVKLIVQMQPVEYAEHSQAAEANIKIVSFTFVEQDGAANIPLIEFPPASPEDVFTYHVQDSSDNPHPAAVTHAQFMRSVAAVVTMGVLTSQDTMAPDKQPTLFSYLPLNHFHERVLHHAAVYHGFRIGVFQGETIQIYNDMRVLRPTHLAALSGTIQHLQQQVHNSQSSWHWLFRKLFLAAYQWQAGLLRTRRYSPALTFLFFRQLKSVLGGRVHNLILPDTTQDVQVLGPLIEFAHVCLQCRVRTVASSTTHGVFLINGMPAPRIRIGFTQSKEAGEVIAVNGVPTPYVGSWSSPSTVDLKGPSEAVLWPVADASVIATHLEREYGKCPLVQDIFVTNLRNRPLIAIVVPKRDALEGWCQRHGKICTTWAELVEHGTEAVQQNLTEWGIQLRFPTIYHIRGVYLHAHRFSEHKSFLTSTGTFRRSRLNSYFRTTVMEMYEKVGIVPLEPSPVGGRTHLDSVHSDPTHTTETSGSALFHSPAAIDIGGTQCKVVFFQPPNAAKLPAYCRVERPTEDGVGQHFGRNLHFFNIPTDSVGFDATEENFTGILRFIQFPTVKVPEFVEFLKSQGIFEHKYNKETIQNIPATGGGAYRYEALIKSSLSVELRQLPELQCTIRGLNFLLRECPDEVFCYDWRVEEQRPLPSDPTGHAHWPFLLVNIGSGVSIVKCMNGEGSYERVSGSTVGGGTFWGLCKLLTNATSWDEIVDITRRDGPGDNINVDLSVGDIYGNTTRDLPAGLRLETVASSFGKIGSDRAKSQGAREPSNSDYVKSLLVMMANNITQISYLVSKIEGIKNIFFVGGFVRDNPTVWRQVTKAMEYWAQGTEVQAKFLQHDGYLGAIGALIEPDAKRAPSKKQGTKPFPSGSFMLPKDK